MSVVLCPLGKFKAVEPVLTTADPPVIPFEDVVPDPNAKAKSVSSSVDGLLESEKALLEVVFVNRNISWFDVAPCVTSTVPLKSPPLGFTRLELL